MLFLPIPSWTNITSPNGASTFPFCAYFPISCYWRLELRRRETCESVQRPWISLGASQGPPISLTLKVMGCIIISGGTSTAHLNRHPLHPLRQVSSTLSCLRKLTRPSTQCAYQSSTNGLILEPFSQLTRNQLVQLLDLLHVHQPSYPSIDTTQCQKGSSPSGSKYMVIACHPTRLICNTHYLERERERALQLMGGMLEGERWIDSNS